MRLLKLQHVIVNLAALLMLIFCIRLVSPTQTYTIGVLIEENEDKYGLEIAMNAAINRTNEFSPHIKFKSVVRYVGKMNAFEIRNTLCNMTANEELVAVVGPQSLPLSLMVQSVCTKFEIPHIQLNWQPHVYKLLSVINFYPSAKLLSEAIATVVKRMSWKNYAILYETTEGLVKLQDVLKIHEPGSRIIVKQLNPSGDNRLLLKSIRNMTNTIILDCEADHILDILHQAKEVKLLEHYAGILLTNLDAHTLDYSSITTETSANFTTLRMTDTSSLKLQQAARLWNYVNSSFPNDPTKIRIEPALMFDAVKYLLDAILVYKTNEPLTPVRISCGEDGTSLGLALVEFMRVWNKPEAVTGPISFKHNMRNNFRLEMVELLVKYNYFNKTAEWTSDNPQYLHVLRSEKEQLEHIRESLANIKVLKVTSRLGPPYLSERDPEKDEKLEGNNRYKGYALDLIHLIATELNFSYEFVITKHNAYANLIKDLKERRAHLAICDLTVTPERSKEVDFSAPFMNLGISILHKKPPKGDTNKFAFMKPFDFKVWIYTVTLYLLASISIYAIARMAPGDWENPHPCNQDPEELENIWDLKNCFWVTLGSIMTQGCDILPKGISSRMATSMWWFFSLIITSSYTANLAAFLTMGRMVTSINSAEDLAKQTKIKYGTVDGGATQAFFRSSNFSTYARLWTQMEQMKPSVFEESNADGVKRVNNTKNELYAFFMEDSSIEYEIERNSNLRQVGGRLDQKSYAIAMAMHTPYRSMIDNTLLKLQENGTLADLKNRWWKEGIDKNAKRDLDDDDAESSSELALSNVGGVFIVLGTGTSIAFGLAIVEFLWNVQQVAIEEHISYWHALWVELKFAINVWITKKRVKPLLCSSSSSGSDDKSIAQRVLQNAGSFLNLDIDKISMNKKK